MKLTSKLFEFGKDIFKFSKENKTTLLTGSVIVGVVLTSVLTANATAKAVRKIDEEDNARKDYADKRATNECKMLGKSYEDVYNDIYTPLTVWDKIKIGWPYYIPPFLSGCTVIASSVYNHKLNQDMLAKEAMATEAAKVALKRYQEKVVEQIGEKKERKIQHELHKDEIREKVLPTMTEEQLRGCDPSTGGILVYEPHTGQKFVTTIEKVRRTFRKANTDLRINETYPLQLVIFDMGGYESDLTYRKVIRSAGQDHDAVEQDYLIDMHLEDFNGHECAIGYLNFDVWDESDI